LKKKKTKKLAKKEKKTRETKDISISRKNMEIIQNTKIS